MRVEIYELIKKIRVQKGIKQSEIASYLGTAQRTYSDIENGKIRLTVDDFMKICNYFNIEPFEILNGNPEKIVLSFSLEEAKVLSNFLSRVNVMLSIKQDQGNS